jgi:nucleotide-binding universal stress UspA family protein
MAVVIGFIPDQYGEAALAHGLDEAQRRQTGVVVVNSTKGDALVDKRYLGAEGKVTLEQRLASTGIAFDLRQTMGRDVADEILEVAADVDADAIVIGIRHRTPVGKLIMGSVAQRILIDARCPVIAVKPSKRPKDL